MALRTLARLVLVSGVATGVLAAAVSLDHPRPQTVRVEPASLVLDESLPHTHVVDPETGGLISVAGAGGVVPDVADLGPVHLDPTPPGVDLSSSTSTGSLLARAARFQAARATADEPILAGATAPLGTPGISSLTRHVRPSCSGTGTDGNRVQVLYLHAAGTTSRLPSMLPILQDELANVDDVFAVSARKTGGGRRVRWVRDGDCLPVIKDVTVPESSLGTNFVKTIAALKTLGFDRKDRKYLAFADAHAICGIGLLYQDSSRTDNANDGAYTAHARVDAPCWTTGHSVAAHELTHMLGGVQVNAPNATPSGHCTDESDLMCYVDAPGVVMRKVCGASEEQLLDCRNDDYFNTRPAPGSYLDQHWNTARSSFLDDAEPLGPAPRAIVVAPARVQAAREFRVSATVTGKGPYTYAWTAGRCRVSSTKEASPAVTCPASRTTRRELVAVTVRQADGQTVRVTRAVTVPRV